MDGRRLVIKVAKAGTWQAESMSARELVHGRLARMSGLPAPEVHIVAVPARAFETLPIGTRVRDGLVLATGTDLVDTVGDDVLPWPQIPDALRALLACFENTITVGQSDRLRERGARDVLRLRDGGLAVLDLESLPNLWVLAHGEHRIPDELVDDTPHALQGVRADDIRAAQCALTSCIENDERWAALTANADVLYAEFNPMRLREAFWARLAAFARKAG